MTGSEDLPLEVLEQARALGFLGPGPVEAHRAHAAGFGEVVETVLAAAPARLVDLGSGGGVPGLVLAARWPDCHIWLVESNQRRCRYLRAVVRAQGWDPRVTVAEERAERVARRPDARERFPVATARGFGEPAVTAEIAAGLVEVGGALVVSEPPGPAPARWPATALRELGFGPAERIELRNASFVAIRKERPAPDRVPRPTGRPAKRPQW